MKKFILCAIYGILTVTTLQAQDCLNFFPAKAGSMLVCKTYDGNDVLLNTTTYCVENGYDYVNGSDMEVSYTMTDNYNNIISRDNLDASCMDGRFYLKLVNRAMSSEVVQMLGYTTELIGNFIDYPNTFSNATLFSDSFEMDAAEYNLRSNITGEEMQISIYNRRYEGIEQVKTPAGIFDAAKITFNFDCSRNGEKQAHRGVEWYAPGAGIVRTETYNADGFLEIYSMLIRVIQEQEFATEN